MSMLNRLYYLRWWVPFRLLPHGIAGSITLLLGALLTRGSLIGDFSLLETGWAVPCYAIAAAINALGGLVLATHITKKNSKGTARGTRARAMFIIAACTQLCLTWSLWRFKLPGAYEVVALPHFVVRFCDILAAGGLLLTNLVTFLLVCTVVSKEQGSGIAAAICTGNFGLLILSMYPVHLAWGGDAWLECVTQMYPKQLHGFAGYVYTPTTWIFAAILFMGTLHDRKIISPLTFAGGSGGLTVGVLVSTVLMQEVFIPFVSTQKLILFCPASPEGSVLAQVGQLFDTSVLAQHVLAYMGMPVVPVNSTSA